MPTIGYWLRSPLAGALDAVSYTHLDVYKRQGTWFFLCTGCPQGTNSYTFYRSSKRFCSFHHTIQEGQDRGQVGVRIECVILVRSSFQYTEADVFLSDLFRKALSEVDRLGIRHILVGVAHLYPRLQREVRGQLVAVGTPVGLVGLGLVVAYGKAEELALKGLDVYKRQVTALSVREAMAGTAL